MKPAMKWLLPAVCLLFTFALIGFYVSTTTKQLGQSSRTFAQLGGDFTLQSHLGPISLSDDLGKVVILYFGYLSCADICPTSMGVLAGALHRLSPEQVDETSGLMISLDPKRDKLENLQKFTAYFHPNIKGVTGSVSSISQVAKQYGVFFNDTNTSGSLEEYSVDHASRFYIIDKQGKLITAMSHTTTSNELAAQIKELL